MLAGLMVGALVGGTLAIVGSMPAAADSACDPDWAEPWDTCAVPTFDADIDDATFVRENVSYTVAGLTVHGIVCRPTASPVGEYPLMVLNHAAGTTASVELTSCKKHSGTDGYVVLMSDYRLPTDAPANDDFCLAEVDDVRAMVEAARDLPDVNDMSLVMRGVSLGGCITLRIHQQGLTGLVAAAAVNPPTDMAGVWTNSNSQYNSNLCSILGMLLNKAKCDQWKDLKDRIPAQVGGVPGPTTQGAYDARSPLTYAADTAASSVPLAIVQGAADYLIPIAQTCAFTKAIQDLPTPAWDFTPIRFGASPLYTVNSTAPSGCPGMGMWLSSNPGIGFPDDHYLMVFDGLRHIDGTVLLANDFGVARNDADLFLMAKD